MGRNKTILNNTYMEVLQEDIKQITDSDLVIKLKAILASLTHNESEVADIFGIARSTLARWISNYKKHGVSGLKSKSRGHNPSKLSTEEKVIIKDWILTCKDSKGKPVHWTLKRLITEILAIFGKEISKTPLWITLIKMNLTLKKPRPRHHKSDKEKQETFKKNSKHD
jgi:transposase